MFESGREKGGIIQLAAPSGSGCTAILQYLANSYRHSYTFTVIQLLHSLLLHSYSLLFSFIRVHKNSLNFERYHIQLS